MKLTNRKITLPVILLFSLLMACHVNNEKKAQAIDKTLSYTVANNYFVKNNVNDLANSKITTREEFDNLFGMAATMGSNGTPTSIDFENQYVIAVIEPDTDL